MVHFFCELGQPVEETTHTRQTNSKMSVNKHTHRQTNSVENAHQDEPRNIYL